MSQAITFLTPSVSACAVFYTAAALMVSALWTIAVVF